MAAQLLPIPDKLFFKIGEVSQLVGVETHVLRYWEREVSAIRPVKSRSNQRRYRRRDVELFLEVRRLLYEEKFTLAGARKQVLAASRAALAEAEGNQGGAAYKIDRLRQGLQELLALCADINPE